MQPMSRVQDNIVSRHERRFLDWSCGWMPEGVTPDHLTVFGVVGAVMVLGGYVASRADPRFLAVSGAGFVVHWFGDSLDGSLARYRRVTRPRYGYFLDHSVDAFCILLMIGGMGLSCYVRMDVALFVVMAYFALSIHVFLKNHVTGTFQLTFMALGPTEMRMGFVALTLWMLIAGDTHAIGSVALSDCDIVLLVMGSVMLSLFAMSTTSMIVHLRALEGPGRRPASGAYRAEPARALATRQSVADASRDHLGGVKRSTAY